MKILKFKKASKDKYKLFFDNNECITLYEDVIINNNLLISKEVDNKLLEELLKQNNVVYTYNMAINYISVRMRSIKEVREYLIKKNASNLLIENTIKRLLKEGYLNDFNFAKSFTNDKLLIAKMGPLKIKSELLKYGIDKNIINEVISEVDKTIVENNLTNLLLKQLKIKKDSTNSLKIKLLNYFINLGYEKDMVIKKISKFEIKSDENKLIRDYKKLYNKYKGKYEGSKLIYFLSQKLYSKGYTSEDIKKVIKDD